jgi:hypothetical protein
MGTNPTPEGQARLRPSAPEIGESAVRATLLTNRLDQYAFAFGPRLRGNDDWRPRRNRRRRSMLGLGAEADLTQKLRKLYATKRIS